MSTAVKPDDVSIDDCECGKWSGETCTWSGPRCQTIYVEFMPEHLRQRHVEARNYGVYPANGAQRIRVEHSCARRMLAADPDWVTALELLES